MTKIALELDVDEEVDCAYVELAELKPGHATTQVVVVDHRIRGEIVIDLDASRNVLGIEFIGYKTMLGLG